MIFALHTSLIMSAHHFQINHSWTNNYFIESSEEIIVVIVPKCHTPLLKFASKNATVPLNINFKAAMNFDNFVRSACATGTKSEGHNGRAQ
jgi:hypothetical protein